MCAFGPKLAEFFMAIKASNPAMRVAVDVHGAVREPYLQVRAEHVFAMMLRHGAIEVGARRSAMLPNHFERFGAAHARKPPREGD